MTPLDQTPARPKRSIFTNERDIQTLGECTTLLKQTKNKLIKKSKTVRYEPISEWIGAAIASVENHARRLDNRYHIMKEQSNDQ